MPVKNISYVAGFIIVFLMNTFNAQSQSLDYDKIKDDVNKLKEINKNSLFNYSGGISANTIFSGGDGNIGRNPFSYYLNGNVNVNIAGLVDLPFSFYITNAGKGFTYPSTPKYPTMPNRFSFNPKYKWIQLYTGDVSMNFSSYTLSGRQFRGAGVVLSPKGGFKFSAMGGRIQQDVVTSTETTQPAYKRFGYGTKIGVEKTKYKLGIIIFAAKDYENSLAVKPDSVNVFPQKNLVISANGSYMPSKNFEISAEYATSALTKDSRDTTTSVFEGNNLLKNVFSVKNSTTFYNALKANLNYKYKNSVIGVGFERIDPGYQTMGGYYFNNDFENITVNFAQPFFNSKGNLSGNLGYQHDDLNHDKMGGTNRTIGSVNVTFVPNKKLFFMGSYSNFSTIMYIKPQFQDLSQQVQFQNITMQDYSQISQTAIFSVNYNMKKTEKKIQSLNLNLSFFDAADRQGGVVRFGSASQLYNGAASYTMIFVPKSISITAALNGTYNTIGKNDFVTFGPTISVSAKLFKKITSNFLTSYNQSAKGSTIQQSALNSRFSLGYQLKNKHNLNVTLLSQFLNLQLPNKTNTQVVTFGYNYTFSKKQK